LIEVYWWTDIKKKKEKKEKKKKQLKTSLYLNEHVTPRPRGSYKITACRKPHYSKIGFVTVINNTILEIFGQSGTIFFFPEKA
jgi:hypothetical protein